MNKTPQLSHFEKRLSAPIHQLSNLKFKNLIKSALDTISWINESLTIVYVEDILTLKLTDN